MLSRSSYGSVESSDVSFSAVGTVPSLGLDARERSFHGVSPTSSSRSQVKGILASATARDALDLLCDRLSMGISFAGSNGVEILVFLTRFMLCNNLILFFTYEVTYAGSGIPSYSGLGSLVL